MSGGKKPIVSPNYSYYDDGLCGEYREAIEKNLKSPANRMIIRLVLTLKEATEGIIVSLDASPNDIIAELAKTERKT